MPDAAPPRRLLLGSGVLFVLVSFALNSAVTRWIVAGDRLDPGLTTMVRFTAGALVLALILMVRGRSRSLRPAGGNLVPAFWLAAYAFLISYGYAFIGAAAGTFVFYACVLLTMTLAGAVMQRRPPAARAAVGGAVSLAGLALLTLGRVEDVTLLGVVLLAATGTAWGAYSLLGKRRRDPLVFTAQNFVLVGLVLLVPLVLALAGVFGGLELHVEGVVAAALMGGITTALSYAVWYWALQTLDSAQAGTYQLAIPVLTAFLGVGWLGETLSVRLVLAGIFVLVGMALATPRRRPTETPLREAAKRPAGP